MEILSLLPKKLQDEVNKKIEQYKLKGKKKEEFIKKVVEEYFNKNIEVYEPIGLITAHSISEPATQMVIDTFHFAGISEMNMMNSLPRLIEILDRKSEPSIVMMEIYLKEKNLDIKKLEEYAKQIKELKFKEIIKAVSLDIVENKIIFKLDSKAMKEYDIDKERIVNMLKSDLRNSLIEATTNEIVITLKKKVKLKQLYLLKEKIKERIIKGIPGIKKVIITENPNTKEFFLLTEGSNLKEVLKLPFVDKKRTIVNNPLEIEKVLGIEAVRAYIVKELKRIFDTQGLVVDTRYFTLVADLLTMFGSYKGVTRHGVAAIKYSVLAKAAFETPRDFIVKASLTGEEDNFDTVLENVLVSQVVPVGTGLIKVKYKIKEE